ncbi:hypothetical protein HFN51_04465 [Rhizobium leguminosarum]|nr:hypothetical protein [Rhizobium leguminosarum]
MNYKLLNGKTLSINYCGTPFEAVAIRLEDDGCGVVMRLDGNGWSDDDAYVIEAQNLGVNMPNNPTFWYVMEDDIEGVMVPATVQVIKSVAEIIAAAEAKPAPVVPSEPQEPTAPMTAQVLQMLRRKGDVTTIEAQGVLRCRSLSKRITELKRLGHNITRTLHNDHTGQRYARYILAA